MDKVKRVVEFDDDIFTEMMESVTAGRFVATMIRENPHYPKSNHFYAWLKDEDGARARYDAALFASADSMVDDAGDIADSAIGIIVGDMKAASDRAAEAGFANPAAVADMVGKQSLNAAKNKIDFRKWLVGKRDPARYGDKVEVAHTGDRDKPVSLDLSKLSVKQLEQLRALQEAATVDDASSS